MGLVQRARTSRPDPGAMRQMTSPTERMSKFLRNAAGLQGTAKSRPTRSQIYEASLKLLVEFTRGIGDVAAKFHSSSARHRFAARERTVPALCLRNCSAAAG